jgi:nitrite reductase (NO-forming)
MHIANGMYGEAHARQPDWMTFNGYAGQYVKHPLTAKPGETVRFWVVDAGPSIDTDFHIVGAILDRAWVNAGMTNKPLENVQTVAVPAGGGGVLDVNIDKPGPFPFVSHAFAAVDKGQGRPADRGRRPRDDDPLAAYGNRNSPRATTTALPPTSTRSMSAAVPVARA